MFIILIFEQWGAGWVNTWLMPKNYGSYDRRDPVVLKQSLIRRFSFPEFLWRIFFESLLVLFSKIGAVNGYYNSRTMALMTQRDLVVKTIPNKFLSFKYLWSIFFKSLLFCISKNRIFYFRKIGYYMSIRIVELEILWPGVTQWLEQSPNSSSSRLSNFCREFYSKVFYFEFRKIGFQKYKRRLAP